MQGRHADDLAVIKAALSDDADILLYGCDIAQDTAGKDFVRELAERTGADVAASDDATGHADFDADWDLEVYSGTIDVRPVMSPLGVAAWHGTLANQTLVWETQYGAFTDINGTSSNTTVGGVTITTTGSVVGTPGVLNLGIDPANTQGNLTGNVRMEMNATTDDGSQSLITTINFSEAVYNVSFTISDIDAANNGFRDAVYVTFNGSQFASAAEVTIATPATNAYDASIGRVMNTDGTTGYGATVTGGNVLFTFAGPVTTITVRFQAADALGVTDPTQQFVAIQDISFRTNDAPILDLDASGAGTGFTSTFTENGPAVQFIDTDSLITDADDTNIESGTIVLTNKQAGDQLLIGATALTSGATGTVSGITYTVTETAGQISIALSGTATKATYETVLEQFRYSSTTDYPSTTPRSISVTINDGEKNSNAAVATVNVVGVYEPVVDLNSTGSSTTNTVNTNVNLVTNGTFADNSGAPANWTESGTVGTGATGRYVWTSGTNSLTQALTPLNGTTVTESVAGSVLTTTRVDTVSTVNTISFDMAWQNADTSNPNDNALTVSYGGVLYATFRTAAGGTQNGAGIAGTWTYSNGASGPATTNSVADETAAGALTAVTITLPGSITAAGNLVLAYGNGTSGAGSDDLAIDNVVVNAAVATTTTTSTTDIGDNGWTATFVENGAAVAIADTDSSIFDFDSANLTSGTVVLTNKQTSDQLVIGATVLNNGSTGTVNGITYTVTETAGQISIALSGTATKAVYADFIETIKFQNGSDAPSTIARTIGVTVNDGIANSNTAVATINITAVNNAPVLDLDGSGAGTGYAVTYTENGTAVAIADVDIAITDVDSTTLTGATITLTNAQAGDVLAAGALPSGITAVVSGNVVTLSGAASLANYQTAIRAITFASTSENPATVTRSISVVVTDGITPSAAATTLVAINLAPDPVNDAVSGNEGSPISGNVLTNDADLGTTPITSVTVATGPTSGTLTAFNTTTGAFTYTPTGDFNGTDTFTYTVTDANGDTKTATVTITVNAVNDTPTVAAPASIPVTEDVASPVTGISFADVDAGVAAVTVTLSVPSGTLAAVTGGSVTVAGSGSGTLTLTGTVANINSFIAASNVAFTTAPNATVNVTLTATINDQGNTGIDPGLTGTATTEQASTTITLAVTAVDDLPVAAADTISATEDGGAVTGSLAGNDTPSGDGGNVWALGSTLPTKGSVVITATGGYTYTPAANQNGSDTFTYTITDADGDVSTATVTVNITAVDDLPVAAADTISATEDGGAVTGSLAGNDTPSGDGGNVWALGSTLPTKGSVVITATGGYTYTPAANQNGSDTFTYTITDADGDVSTATVTVNITAVDDLPVAAADTISATEDGGAVTGSLAGNDTPSGDGGNVWALGSTLPTKGSVVITATGGYTYTPAANQNGSDTFTYTITDADGDVSTATVTVNITAVDDLPVAAADTISATEDGGAVTGSLAGNDTPSGDGGNVWALGSTLPTKGSVVITATGGYTYTPAANQNGSDTFTYTITDADGDVSTAPSPSTSQPLMICPSPPLIPSRPPKTAALSQARSLAMTRHPAMAVTSGRWAPRSQPRAASSSPQPADIPTHPPPTRTAAIHSPTPSLMPTAMSRQQPSPSTSQLSTMPRFSIWMVRVPAQAMP